MPRIRRGSREAGCDGGLPAGEGGLEPQAQAAGAHARPLVEVAGAVLARGAPGRRRARVPVGPFERPSGAPPPGRDLAGWEAVTAYVASFLQSPSWP